MGRDQGPSRGILGPIVTCASPAAALAFLEWGLDPLFRSLYSAREFVADTSLFGLRVNGWALIDVIHQTRSLTQLAGWSLAWAMTMAVSLGWVARIVARERVRSGFADPLEPVRRFTRKHVAATRAILALPALVWAGVWTGGITTAIRRWGDVAAFGEASGTPIVRAMHDTFNLGMAVVGVCALVVSAGIHALTRAGSNALLAKSMPDESRPEEPGDRLHFDAIAVTFETRAAIAAMALLPVLIMLTLNKLGISPERAIVAYVVLALAGIVAFRSASRIAVGCDGIYVGGSSRARFFAYSSLEGVHVRENKVELLRGAKAVLVLQLYGKDSEQQSAIVLRVREAIARAHGGTSVAAGHIVLNATERQLLRLAGGAADYRTPTLTREQLWDLVEGPGHDQATRTAAAKVLAKTSDADERTRLRIAADRHAEPRARIVLRELAALGDEDDNLEAAAEEARLPR
jgi:hypothetical protein